MPWNITNVSLDPRFANLRRTASKMEMEPLVAGVRVRLRQKITISGEQYANNKERIEQLVQAGVLSAEQIGETTAEKKPEVSKVEAPPEPSKDEPRVEESWTETPGSDESEQDDSYDDSSDDSAEDASGEASTETSGRRKRRKRK